MALRGDPEDGEEQGQAVLQCRGSTRLELPEAWGLDVTVSRFWIPSVISGAALCSALFDVMVVLPAFSLQDALQSHRIVSRREGHPAADTPVLVAPAPVGEAEPGATPDPLSAEGKSGRANSWLESDPPVSKWSARPAYTPRRGQPVANSAASMAAHSQGESLDGGRKDGAKTSALRVRAFGDGAAGPALGPTPGRNRVAGFDSLRGRSRGTVNIEAGIKSGRHLQTLADSAQWVCGTPEGLLHAVVEIESRWNPDARGAHGEIGLGQLSLETARFMGVKDRSDPWQNLLGSACFLSWHYGRTGNWTRAVERFNGRGPMARAYSQRVMRLWEGRESAKYAEAR